MTTAAEIEWLERRFWQALVDRDFEGAAVMIAPEALVVNGRGVGVIDGPGYQKMAEEGGWVLDAFAFSDVKVTFPAEGVAAIAYRARQTVTGEGKTREMDVADASVWVMVEGEWRCALHTEVEVG